MSLTADERRLTQMRFGIGYNSSDQTALASTTPRFNFRSTTVKICLIRVSCGFLISALFEDPVSADPLSSSAQICVYLRLKVFFSFLIRGHSCPFVVILWHSSELPTSTCAFFTVGLHSTLTRIGLPHRALEYEEAAYRPFH